MNADDAVSTTAAVAAGPTRDGVVHAYRRYAPLYDLLFGLVLEPGRRALGAAVAALAPRSILEIGVGTGLVLGRYPPQADCVGIDLSPDMLARAKRRADAQRAMLAAMDAERLAFADASFDCVTLPYVLSVTPDPTRLIAEARRVCRRDGYLVILNHFSGAPGWGLLERLVRPLAEHLGFRSDLEFHEHIRTRDWIVESVREVNLFKLSRLVVIRNG